MFFLSHSHFFNSTYLLIYPVTALVGVLCSYPFKKKAKKMTYLIRLIDCLEYLATYVRNDVQHFEHMTTESALKY